MKAKELIGRYADKGRYSRAEYDAAALAAVEETRRLFPYYKNITYRYYTPRPLQRYLLLGEQFADFLKGKILDVGSRDNTIREVLKKDCELVDKNNPTLPPFDWEKENLPYPDGSFDTVVCLDTLEHIERIHEAFSDLLRVSRKYVIISLPNNWRKMAKQFFLGYGIGAGYGLPPEKPLDRHRWFFNTEELEEFVFYNSAVSGAKIISIKYHIPRTIFRHRILYPLLSFLLPERYFKNVITHTVFVCFEKVYSASDQPQ